MSALLPHPNWRQPDASPYGCREGVAVVIGNRIASRRRAVRMTQAALSRAVGCDRSAAARWEVGLRLPTVPNLVAVGRALGCGAGDLLPDA